MVWAEPDPHINLVVWSMGRAINILQDPKLYFWDWQWSYVDLDNYLLCQHEWQIIIHTLIVGYDLTNIFALNLIG